MLLPHVSAAYNNSVNVATGFAPNEIHISHLPRLPLSVFEPENIGGHQSLDRDHLVSINLATDRQQRAYSLVRKLHRLTVSRLQRRNAPIMAALHGLETHCDFTRRLDSCRRRQLWKSRGGGRCEGRDAGLSTSLGDSTGSSL